MNIRIAKFISNAGYCSRRQAEQLIVKNKVYINDEICRHPSQKVTDYDIVRVNDEILKMIKEIKLWKMYKPVRYISSTKDKLKRKKIYDLLPKGMPKVISIGRLDYMSEGLILFTNKGEYSRYLELPSSNIERTYRVCVEGNVKETYIQKINKGISIKKINYNKVKLNIEKVDGKNIWLIFRLREGKNREIRNICSFFSWKIIKLIRIGYGPYKLGKLKIGEIKQIKVKNND